MPRGWINKPVGFKEDDPDDMELYRFAGSLPNFTFAVKQYLRSLRVGHSAPVFVPDDSQPYAYEESELVDDVAQFLI